MVDCKVPQRHVQFTVDGAADRQTRRLSQTWVLSSTGILSVNLQGVRMPGLSTEVARNSL